MGIKLSELVSMHREATEADKSWTAEIRSNVLLVSGDHYLKTNQKSFERIRETKDLSKDQKVRLTKNHIGVISKIYANNLLAAAPGIVVEAKNAGEMQDRKAAEMYSAVWEDAKERHNFDELFSELADDFFLGETAIKMFFDPNAGHLVGFNQAVDDMGQPVFDEMGQPVPDQSSPKFSGDILVEKIFCADLKRAPEAKSMDESPYLFYQKMVSVKDLKKTFPDTADKIKESEDRTFMVFDFGADGGYRKADKNETMLIEYYQKPCADYPNGYFALFTEDVVLAEGELPKDFDGKHIFPIVVQHMDKIPTTPRGRSLIKQLRPYQVEINRCASKIAEHQMTLGDDKVVTTNGNKMSTAGMTNGVRHLSVNGGGVTVIPGRNGSQYLDYMLSQISEMYKVAMVQEDQEFKQGQDPFTMLFMSARQKKSFSRYIRRMENMIIKIAKLYFRMAKTYFNEDTVISYIGRSERVNIQEFKSASDLSLQIKVKPRSDDITSQMGKQMVLNSVIQYAANGMSKEDIGKIIKEMPFAQVSEVFNDMTLNSRVADNIILALDRGEDVQVFPEDDNAYILGRLSDRMRQPDFRLMNPFIQGLYAKQRQMRSEVLNQQKEQLAAQNQGLIPTTGAMIGVDMYVTDPKDPAKSRRLRVPSDSMAWLIKRIEEQGVGMADIYKLNPQDQAAMGGTQPIATPGTVIADDLGMNVPSVAVEPQYMQMNNPAVT
jgi:hypothetical protein